MDAFVEKLAEICGAEPTAEKWVVLPSVRVGLAIGERLAREGRAWINMRFTTPAQIAEGLAGPRLVALGVGRLREDVGAALVSRLLQGLGGGGKSYFRRMGDDPRAGHGDGTGAGRIYEACVGSVSAAGVLPEEPGEGSLSGLAAGNGEDDVAEGAVRHV
jgi:hypothetical protein